MRVFLLLLYFAIFFFIKSNAQFYFPAEKLVILDTIYDRSAIARLNEQRLQYISPAYFTVSKYKNLQGLILIARENNYCLAIDLPADHKFETGEIKFNGKYFYYETIFSNASRGNLQTSRSFNIIDPVKKIFFEVPSMVSQETWDTDLQNDKSVLKSCNCKLTLEQDAVTSFQFSKGLADCIGSGRYRITNDSLIKFQHYDEDNFRMADVRWAGNIATWMTLDEVRSIYPDVATEKMADRYSICAEDERPAYSIIQENDTLAIIYLDRDEKYVQKIIVLSDKIKFGNIKTGLTAKEVFTRYPKAKVETDLLSELEYIFLKDLNIKLVFNTTDENRIGKYKNEQFIGLLRPSARIDYIEIN